MATKIVILVILAACIVHGRELQQGGRQAAKMAQAHQRTTSHDQDESLATTNAMLAATAPVDATAAPVDATATLQAAAAVASCPSPQFEWPTGSGYCWYRRDSGGVQAGPGSNVFSAANVAVNSQDQLVLTIANPNNKIAKSSCGEVFLNRSLGYGDYTFVVATNPTMIDYRLVGAPFIYATDTQEYDFEFSRWNVNSGTPNNSQVVVQPYTVNKPARWWFSAVDTTHRIRWTPEAVVFESYYPESQGGGLMFSWSYSGANNFMPGAERVHVNFWIYSRVKQVPLSSTFVTNCFRFCAQADLATCSSPLRSKPRCSDTRAW